MFWLVVALATGFLLGPIRGQGWTYQPIGLAFQSDESSWEKEENSLDFRYISYRRNLETGSVFHDYTSLISNVQVEVDEGREQLLVGGRDVLYRLHLDNLTLIERAEWPSPNKTAELCTYKGENAESCRNFVRVLILLKDQGEVFTCGTNAFYPECTVRNASRLSEVSRNRDGRGICPYSPDYNATSLMTSQGDLYTATVIDFQARDPAILKRQESAGTLRTMKGNSKWLNEPNFVSTYEIGNFVYFFFRETAVEYINCGKKIYSRVARVCKSDEGGLYSLANTWTSFLKARLNCSLPGTFPFYFDELQSTFLSDDGQEIKEIYAVFTTPPNSIAGSAVCVFTMTAFHDAFEGSFKHQDAPDSAWVRNDNHYSKGKCSSDSSAQKRSSSKSADAFMAVKKYQLMDDAVKSREVGPLIMRENERWTHIVVDTLPGRDFNYYNVLFLATDDGKLRKMLRLPHSETTCLIEEIKIVENGHPRPVHNMKISPEKGAVYISMEGNILKVPVQRCYRFTTKNQCIGANDPYCGWHNVKEQCTTPPDNDYHSPIWEQEIVQCPVLSYPVNGGWGAWSSWSVCEQVGENSMVSHCLCRSRPCDNPRPANHGLQCKGASTQISNCTVDGNWTQWSAWSACSETCGFALKTRQRECGNPAPKFGGRNCDGEYIQRRYCNGNPECPSVAIDGGWSRWSGWSSCTKQCSSGMQIRKRKCDKPEPSHGGSACDGNKDEWRSCNTQRCAEKTRLSPWTEWVKTNHTEGGYFKQRFRFTCRANVARTKDIKTAYGKSQAKFCFTSGRGGCYKRKELANSITTIDTFSSVDKVLKKYCWKRKRFLKNKYCKCRTLGVFLVCRKCEVG